MDSLDSIKKESTSQTSRQRERSTPPRSDPPPAVKEPPDQIDNNVTQGASNADAAQPLAPPPRPAPNQQNPSESDYFSGTHGNSHFSLEPNPFEQSFGNPSTETPGSKSLLPPVAALTSPSAPLLGGAASAGGYNWSNSLRSGPLSPAMLGGPVGPADYFDPSIRGSFPTPNESSLRTGLTPGGGGSMFPAPSPNSQALYQQLANGGATPGTLDFHRTAMNAAAARKDNHKAASKSNAQSQEKRAPVAPMDHSNQQQQQQQQQSQQQPPQPPPPQQQPQSAFGPHDNDAANGLYLLAQAGNGTQSNNQFAIPNPPNPPNGNATNSDHGRAQETSPNLAKRVGTNGSIGDSLSGSVRAVSEISEVTDSGDQSRPATRARGKRASAGKAGGPANGRRKAEETPAKQPSAKKTKANDHQSLDMNMDGMDSEEETNIKEEQYHENGKKMTDEEKRKNFLERNRVAALKCRQRKKQWLANLQAKVEIFSSENDSLSAQVAQLREEIVAMKQIMLQHKDCSVTQSQGQGLGPGPYFPQPEFTTHTNPYGIMGQNGQQVMASQRR
ncbi:hypothetical protein MMC07_003497 [Pseudocyphellaria aurata]|nr:hypothetical protein [Pseudocyphellaria aurata]